MANVCGLTKEWRLEFLIRTLDSVSKEKRQAYISCATSLFLAPRKNSQSKFSSGYPLKERDEHVLRSVGRLCVIIQPALTRLVLDWNHMPRDCASGHLINAFRHLENLQELTPLGISYPPSCWDPQKSKWLRMCEILPQLRKIALVGQNNLRACNFWSEIAECPHLDEVVAVYPSKLMRNQCYWDPAIQSRYPKHVTVVLSPLDPQHYARERNAVKAMAKRQPGYMLERPRLHTPRRKVPQCVVQCLGAAARVRWNVLDFEEPHWQMTDPADCG